LIGAVGVHDINFRVIEAAPRKDDAGTVGRPSWVLIGRVIGGEAGLVGAIRVHREDAIVLIAEGVKGDACAVGRPG